MEMRPRREPNYFAVQGISLIAVTSYAMVGDREKSLAAGCNGYIEKPINPETFSAEVERFCPPRDKPRETRPATPYDFLPPVAEGADPGGFDLNSAVFFAAKEHSAAEPPKLDQTG